MYLELKAKTSLRVLKIQHPGDGFESPMNSVITIFRSTWWTKQWKSRHRFFLGCDRSPKNYVPKLGFETPI